MYKTYFIFSLLFFLLSCSNDDKQNELEENDFLVGTYTGTIDFEGDFDYLDDDNVALEIFEAGSLPPSNMSIFDYDDFGYNASIVDGELDIFLYLTNLVIDGKTLAIDFRATAIESGSTFTAIDEDAYIESDDPYIFESVRATLVLTKVD